MTTPNATPGPLNSIETQWNDALASKDSKSLSSLILSGRLSEIRQFPIDTFADLVNHELRQRPTDVESRVLYAFMLSASQQPEAIMTLDKSIESVFDNNTLLSQLQSFKGWLYTTLALSEARPKETTEALCWEKASEAFDAAIKLGSVSSRFLYCNNLVTMMSRDVCLFL
jgi:hypothetical protein